MPEQHGPVAQDAPFSSTKYASNLESFKKGTLKANWFDTISLKQWEVIMNNDFFFCDQLGNTSRAAPTYITGK